MHYYSFHPGDYLKDTAHLSLLEDATYRRLIDFYYISEQPIPVGTQSVARRLRLEPQMVDAVLSEFFELRDDGWHQARCDDEIEAYHALCERNRANGKAGGRRKRTQSQPSGNPVATQMGGQNEANHKPLTINHELSTKVDKAAARGTKEELVAYAIELGLQASDGDFMFENWSANGWKNGNAASKDWKAGMRKWKQGGWMPSQKAKTAGTPKSLQRNAHHALTTSEVLDF